MSVIVSVTNPSAIVALLKLTSVSKLLFGSDAPYMQIESTVSELGELELSPSDILSIERDNALYLMPSLRARN